MCFIKDFSTKILLLSTYILKKYHHVPSKQIKSCYLKVSYDLRLSDRLSRRERNVSLRNSSPFDAGTKVVLEILHDIINDNKSIVKHVIIKSSKLFLRIVYYRLFTKKQLSGNESWENIDRYRSLNRLEKIIPSFPISPYP